MRMSAGLVGQHRDPGGAEIKVLPREKRLIERGEIVEYAQSVGPPSDLQDAGAVVGAADVGVKRSVGSSEENIAVVVRGQAAPGLPNISVGDRSIRGGIKNPQLHERTSAVSDHPAASATAVATVRSKSQVHNSLRQQEGGPRHHVFSRRDQR